MTEKEKDILIAKMLEAPSSLSDAELDIILHDDELRDIYECSVAVKGAYLSCAEIDARREWKLFRPGLVRRKPVLSRLMKVAAVFLAVVSAAVIILKFIGVGEQGSGRDIVAEAELQSAGATVGATGEETHSAEDAVTVPVVADADTQAAAVEAPVKIARSKARNVKAEPEIDIDEYLRLQQAEIDQEFALIIAEILLDRHEAMMDFIEYIDCDATDEKDANIIIL